MPFGSLGRRSCLVFSSLTWSEGALPSPLFCLLASTLLLSSTRHLQLDHSSTSIRYSAYHKPASLSCIPKALQQQDSSYNAVQVFFYLPDIGLALSCFIASFIIRRCACSKISSDASTDKFERHWCQPPEHHEEVLRQCTLQPRARTNRASGVERCLSLRPCPSFLAC